MIDKLILMIIEIVSHQVYALNIYILFQLSKNKGI